MSARIFQVAGGLFAAVMLWAVYEPFMLLIGSSVSPASVIFGAFMVTVIRSIFAISTAATKAYSMSEKEVREWRRLRI